jgi:hypothetical protein
MTKGESSKKNKDLDFLCTVQRAPDILNCFSLQEAQVSLIEIAK